MGEFLKPNRDKVMLAVAASLLSLFVFQLLFHVTIVGWEMYGGYIEEENMHSDALRLDFGYTAWNVLSHLIAGYLFACFFIWGRTRIRRMEGGNRRLAVSAMFIASLPPLVLLLPYLLLRLVSVIRPDYCHFASCLFAAW